ncbi:MAG: thiamine phosphate synthase [Rickettsiales bacterium]|nr:thiamine phosphate synthase [Rickettsiales bacterium]
MIKNLQLRPKIYLISPPEIILKDFAKELDEALKTKLVPVFQLRLKNYQISQIKKIALELQKICQQNNCLFLLNDFVDLALEIGADGVHLGAQDDSVKLAYEKIKKITKNSVLSSIRNAKIRNAKAQGEPQNFIIGASCYDSKHLTMIAGEQGANYVSFGTFFPSKTKNSQGKPTTEILKWCNEITNLPIVAIGGITDQNCNSLVKAGADFLAVISYVWQNSSGVSLAITKLEEKIKIAAFG